MRQFEVVALARKHNDMTLKGRLLARITPELQDDEREKGGGWVAELSHDKRPKGLQ